MPHKDPEKRRAYGRMNAKRWRLSNLERAKENERRHTRKRQAENPEQVRAWRRSFYARHKERLAPIKRAYYEANKDKKSAYDKARREAVGEKLAAQQKAWREANRERLNAKAREKRQTHPQFAIANRMRGRINTALRHQGLKRDKPLEKLIGCTVPQLIRHIESKFKPGMSWANRREWHIDHVEPCAAFDLRDAKQQAICFHWSNLEPIRAKENMSKSAKRLKQAELPLD